MLVIIVVFIWGKMIVFKGDGFVDRVVEVFVKM